MSEPASRYRVVNQRDQPVELHCGGRVVVLAARAAVELGAEEVAHPQLQGLDRRGLISIQPLPEPEPDAAVPTATRQARSKAPGGKTK